MKIMFVCSYNTCRSAMAKGIMQKKLKEKNIDIEVYSCGIHARTGEYASYNAIEAAKYYDVDITLHRSTNIRESNIKEMDLILCATRSNKENVILLYSDIKEKVFTMKEFAEIDNNGQDLDIKDPWGYDNNIYSNSIVEIEKVTQKIIEKIEKK